MKQATLNTTHREPVTDEQSSDDVIAEHRKPGSESGARVKQPIESQTTRINRQNPSTNQSTTSTWKRFYTYPRRLYIDFILIAICLYIK